MMRAVGFVVIVSALVAGCGGGADPAATSSPTSAPPGTPTATATVGPSESPTGTAVACSPFGSTDDIESGSPQDMSSLTGAAMRVGRHDCFERFVFEMTGTGEVPGWSVGYRDPMAADGSGEPVELLGGADLEVVVRVWTVTDFEGRPDEWPPFLGPDDIVTTGYVALKEARNLYAFEGVTQVGLGLDRQRPFRASWLDDPARVVVDVYTGEPL